MANAEHASILGRGVEEWRQWRILHPKVIPDFSRSHLYKVDLSRADLNSANLSRAHLGRADLSHADLSRAGLKYANLIESKLDGANLVGAHLQGANLEHASLIKTNLSGADLRLTYCRAANLNAADLSHADLSGAILPHANLTGADLTRANLAEAHIGATVFADVDLRKVLGLKNARHSGPSEISIRTLYTSEGNIPEVFLRGCGLKDWEIEATKLFRTDLSRNEVVELTYRIIELRSDPLIQFNSCFISYSSEDEAFAKRLYSGLQKSGVRCWFAPENMKIGDRIRLSIDDSILMHDKLLLILSEASLASQWIEQEVETALEKERTRRCDVLFPIRLDDAVMKVQSGWPALVKKTRHIGDFSRWKDNDEYNKAASRLLADLRVDAK